MAYATSVFPLPLGVESTDWQLSLHDMQFKAHNLLLTEEVLYSNCPICEHSASSVTLILPFLLC